MLKEEKKNFVAEFSNELKDKALIYVDYTGMDAETMTELRTQIREQNGLIKVVKNKLLTRMFEKQSIEYEKKIFVGMTALVSCPIEEFGQNGKHLYEAEKQEKLSIKGGYFEGKKVDATFVKKVATIPSKKELYGMLVACLQGTMSNLVFTLDAIKQQKQKDTSK